ncbi:hypothetical protein VTL71DRAFT_12692 [Oculimacula yallundae]|uniref:Secreted protein n=1 Tax=Oculimacula yallundae TaxID=86028 RepID=A0ABR4CNY7_9HELO
MFCMQFWIPSVLLGEDVIIWICFFSFNKNFQSLRNYLYLPCTRQNHIVEAESQDTTTQSNTTDRRDETSVAWDIHRYLATQEADSYHLPYIPRGKATRR